MFGMSKSKWVIIAFLLVIPVTLSFCGVSAVFAADKPDIVTILLCPLGCGPTEGDTILGGLIARKDPNLILRAQETPGYVYNLREMGMNKARWKNTVFATEDDMLNYAPLRNLSTTFGHSLKKITEDCFCPPKYSQVG
jgi:hypothetical protein